MKRNWDQSGALIFDRENNHMVCSLIEPHTEYIECKKLEINSNGWDLAMENGRLIIAAPELLEACILATDSVSGYESGVVKISQVAYDNMCLAITRAM